MRFMSPRLPWLQAMVGIHDRTRGARSGFALPKNMPAARRRAYHHVAAVIMALSGHAVARATVHDVETHRFENGLTLHIASGHAAPVAAVQAWVGVGSA